MSIRELYLHLFQAYVDARKNERNKHTQLEFELDLERNLRALTLKIYRREWSPLPSICFIIDSPSYREVFAPQFEDRVVSHLLFNMVYPIFERYFIYDSYSCRKQKGTHFGIKRMAHHLKSCTQNFTKEAYVLNIDIKGYFVHIDKNILYEEVLRIIRHYESKHPDELDYDLVYFLTEKIIWKDPTTNGIKITKGAEWENIPKGKSLYDTPKDVGLAIGDIMSQLLSNVYLNIFDQFVKRKLKAKYYGRYVDDSKIISTDKTYLIHCRDEIEVFLRDRLHLELHPNKTNISPAHHNVFFLGACIKQNRIYVKNKTIKRYKVAIAKIKPALERHDKSALSIANSILGGLIHFDEYNTRKMLMSGIKNAIINNNYAVIRYE